MKLKSFRQKDRYGNEMAVEFFEVPPMQTPEYDHPGEPRGPDTVPAWLTPGEYVVNAEAVRMFEPEIEAMNEAGREVQRSQGGTIPEYKAEGGGIIQGITDYFTMPPAPPGIEYRRMPDNSIGMFTEKVGTGGGQRYLGRLPDSKPSKSSDFSNFLGINYKEEGGYTMPDFLSDEALDPIIKGMYATETSSGANVKPSPKGAIGPMQILPSTAANPGYGMRSYSEEEIMDLEGAQDFAKNYLRAIHRQNPNFDLEQTVTSYHSGPERVKENRLGEQGKSYFPSVISEANAAVPAANADEPPKPEDDGNWYDFLFKTYDDRVADKQAKMAELEKTNPELHAKILQKEARAEAHKVEKARPPIRTGLGEEQQEKGLLDRAANQAQQESAGFKVLQAESNVKKIQIQDEIKKAEEAYQRKQDSLKEVIEAGGTPSEAMIADTEFAQKKINDLKQEEEQLTETANAAEAEYNSRNAERMERAKQAAGIPPKPDAESKDNAEEGKNNADSVIRQLGPVNEVTPEGDASIQEYLNSLDNNPDEKNKFEQGLNTAKGWFTEAFKEMFSGPELARMAIMYTGSRVLGYDHGSALNYSMKNYMTRVDADVKAQEAAKAKLAERRFDLAKSNLDNYTAASAQKFMQTLNPNDLVPKSGGTTIKEVSGSLNFIGKGRVNTYKDDDGIEYVKLDEAKKLGYPNGYVPVSVLGDYVQPWDESTMGSKANRTYFEGLLETSRKKFSTDDAPIDALPTKIPTQLNAEFNDYIRSHGVGINDSERTRIQFAEVIDKYMSDVARAKREGTPVPTDIAAYVQAEMVIPLTGINSAFLNGINTESLAKLDKKVIQSLDMSPYEEGFELDYKVQWKSAEEVFNRLPVDKVAADALAESMGIKKIVPREDWTVRAKGKNETAFSLWLANTSFDDIQKFVDHFKL